LGLVVEDVHWADSETLDCLTFLGRAGSPGAVRVVVTCRSDEAPLKPQVAEWLALARGAAATEEITLGPLSRQEVARQAAAAVHTGQQQGRLRFWDPVGCAVCRIARRGCPTVDTHGQVAVGKERSRQGVFF
jgi:hypothetical protein